MNKVKKLFIYFLIISGFGAAFYGAVKANSLSEIQNRGFVKVSTNAQWEPFENKDGNKFVGIDIDIAQKIADKLGVQLEINDVSYSALTFELSNKKCDFAIAGWSADEEKKKVIDFSDPYFKSRQMIMVQNISSITKGEDLHGKKIGVLQGSTGDRYCTDNFKNSEICWYDTGSEAGFELAHGNVDAVVIDEMQAKKSVSVSKGKLKMLDVCLFEEDYRIAVPKGSGELLEFINSALDQLKSSGELNAVISEHISKYISNQDNGSEKMSLIGQIHKNLIYKDRYKMIISGLLTTFEITIVALLIGLMIGILVALARVNRSRKLVFKIFKVLANFYSAAIRGTPLVVQLFIMYYFILSASGLSKVAVAMIAFGINSGAYVAEHIRAGILSIDHGQYEAGQSLGLRRQIIMNKIILPQAVKNVFPTLVTEFINLIKETAIAGFIGVLDLSKAGSVITSQTFEPMVPLLTVALIYLFIVMMLSALLSFLERRLRRSDSR